MDEPRKFIIWPEDDFSAGILKICPFEVELEDFILLADIENFVEGKWSSYLLSTDNDYCRRNYFFELESDAMAFKLKWA